MVDGIVSKVDEVQFQQLTFNSFMDTCVTEIDPSINTQMGAARSLSEYFYEIECIMSIEQLTNQKFHSKSNRYFRF